MTKWLLGLATGNPLLLLWIAGGIFVAGLAMGAGGAWTVQGWRLEAAQANLDACQMKIAVLGDKIREQNAGIEDERKKRQEAQNRAAVATKQARAVAESHSALVASLDAKSKAPRAGEGPIKVMGCQDALSEIRAVIR